MKNSTHKLPLEKKVVIITGGLGFLGKIFSKSLIENGAKLFILDLLEKKSAEKIINNFLPISLKKQAFYYQVDITKKNELENIKNLILKKEGRIDVLINNAAINPKVEDENKFSNYSNKFEDLTVDQWNKELAVNLTGTMLCCQVFGSAMKSGSSIINISSIYGVVAPDQTIYPKGFYKPATYGVSKAGVINLTKYLAGYWGDKNIRVNCLVFGGVENGQSLDFIKKYKKRTLLKRMAQGHDYEGIIIYLSSDSSSYATGSVFVIDGGWTSL